MAHLSHHLLSRTSEVRAGFSWAQDNPLPARHETRYPYNAHGHCIHSQAHIATVRASIPYMRYGVHNYERLDKYFYYDPCESAWIIQESGTHAEDYTVHLLEQEARSSGGLSY